MKRIVRFVGANQSCYRLILRGRRLIYCISTIGYLKDSYQHKPRLPRFVKTQMYLRFYRVYQGAPRGPGLSGAALTDPEKRISPPLWVDTRRFTSWMKPPTPCIHRPAPFPKVVNTDKLFPFPSSTWLSGLLGLGPELGYASALPCQTEYRRFHCVFGCGPILQLFFRKRKEKKEKTYSSRFSSLLSAFESRLLFVLSVLVASHHPLLGLPALPFFS